jgi:hypothetical protein
MDKFASKHKGVRGGHICPCCQEARTKAEANRLARRRLAVETRREVQDAGE